MVEEQLVGGTDIMIIIMIMSGLFSIAALAGLYELAG